MPVVVRFVRQLSHDLRNHLNAAELQSAYLKEIAGEAEVKTEVQRLRGMLSELGASLQRLTASLAQVKLTEMPYDALALVEDLQQKVAALRPNEAQTVEWTIDLPEVSLPIDPQLLLQAILELFSNAMQHGRGLGPLRARAEVKDGQFLLELHEPKTNFDRSTDDWGREPFRQVGHGHYGLGLHRARLIIEAHAGRLDARYDAPSSTLVTTVILPTAKPE